MKMYSADKAENLMELKRLQQSNILAEWLRRPIGGTPLEIIQCQLYVSILRLRYFSN